MAVFEIAERDNTQGVGPQPWLGDPPIVPFDAFDPIGRLGLWLGSAQDRGRETRATPVTDSDMGLQGLLATRKLWRVMPNDHDVG